MAKPKKKKASSAREARLTEEVRRLRAALKRKSAPRKPKKAKPKASSKKRTKSAGRSHPNPPSAPARRPSRASSTKSRATPKKASPKKTTSPKRKSSRGAHPRSKARDVRKTTRSPAPKRKGTASSSSSGTPFVPWSTLGKKPTPTWSKLQPSKEASRARERARKILAKRAAQAKTEDGKLRKLLLDPKAPILEKRPRSVVEALIFQGRTERITKLVEEGRASKSDWIRWTKKNAEELFKKAEKADELRAHLDKVRKELVVPWRKNRDKPRPSRTAITLFEELGEWRQHDDGTFTGRAQYLVPSDVGDDMSFRDWLSEVSERIGFLDDEPLWCAIGLQLGGAGLRGKSARYDRIQGKVGAVTQWYRMCLLADQPQDWGGPPRESGKDCASSPTWPGLLEAVDAIASNCYRAGHYILGMVVFGHYGPMKPPEVLK